jgi:hypothetical protein
MRKVNRKRWLLTNLSGAAIAIAIVVWPVHAVFGVLLLLAVCWTYGAIARWRDWGSEGRLTRYLNRPPFVTDKTAPAPTRPTARP